MGIDLDYYLWKNKIAVKDFAKRIKVCPNQLSAIRNKRVTPKLKTAMKIHKESKQQIPYIEMLATQDMEGE